MAIDALVRIVRHALRPEMLALHSKRCTDLDGQAPAAPAAAALATAATAAALMPSAASLKHRTPLTMRSTALAAAAANTKRAPVDAFGGNAASTYGAGTSRSKVASPPKFDRW